jgi:hypothetical protein
MSRNRKKMDAIRAAVYGGVFPLVGGLLFGILVLMPPAAADQEPLHTRVSFDSGGGMVKGHDDADWSYATVNSIVLPGDTLWVDKEGTLELEMSGGTFLRMADGSKAEIASLPPSAAVKGWTGSFYVQRVARSSGDVVFQTPVANVAVERDTQVRLDLISNGATTVSVRWGRAVIRCEGGRDTVLEQGQRSYIDPGYLPSAPAGFDRSDEDAFDSWNRARARLLAVGTDAIPPPVEIKSAPMGVADLAPYGEWVYVDSSYYWRPTVVVDFVPYRVGHWSFVPGCGYVWVGDYPFSYVTGHYGRWVYRNDYGWLWTYRDVWGPAWVATVRYGPNFVWCPLDPFDSPIVVTAGYFAVGGVHFGMYASTYCAADDLLLGPCIVHPCAPVIFEGVPVAEINIWNININGNPRWRPGIPYRDATIRVRDYSPRRVIRGLDIIGPGKEAARARVAALETGTGKIEFPSGGVKGPRRIRTPEAPATRVAQPRSVRIDQATLSKTQELVRRAPSVPSRAAVSGPGRSRGVRSAEGVSAVPKTRRPNVPETVLPKPMRPRGGQDISAPPSPLDKGRTPDITVPAPSRRREVTPLPETPRRLETPKSAEPTPAPVTPRSRGTRTRIPSTSRGAEVVVPESFRGPSGPVTVKETPTVRSVPGRAEAPIAPPPAPIPSRSREVVRTPAPVPEVSRSAPPHIVRREVGVAPRAYSEPSPPSRSRVTEPAPVISRPEPPPAPSRVEPSSPPSTHEVRSGASSVRSPNTQGVQQGGDSRSGSRRSVR